MAEDKSTSKPYGYVYLIRNLINGKIYIGQTTHSVEERWSGHKKQRHRLDYPLYRALRKYGPDNFSISTIATAVSQVELNRQEEEFVALYKAAVNGIGYNVRRGGSSGGALSPATKEKLKLALAGHPPPNKGKPMSAQQRRWLVEHWKQVGPRIPTDGERAAMSSASLAYWNTENRERQSERLTERWADPVFTAEMSAKRKVIFGSPEVRARNSAAQLVPEVRARKSAATREQWKDPTFAAKKSQQAKDQWKNNPEKMRAALATPERRAGIVARNLKLWGDPEYKRKRLASMEAKRLERSKANRLLW